MFFLTFYNSRSELFESRRYDISSSGQLSTIRFYKSTSFWEEIVFLWFIDRAKRQNVN